MKVFLALVLLAGTQLSFAALSAVYVFGDSLSDVGNARFISEAFSVIPNQPSRFTNGPVWNERLGVPMAPSLEGGTNFAVGGAQTDRGAIPLTGIPGQLDQFELTLGGAGADPTALYVLFIGGNDLARIFGEAPSGALPSILGGVNNVIQSVIRLQSLGAQNLLVANVPDISLTPRLRAETGGNASSLSRASNLVSIWNAGLTAALNGLADPKVQLLDINTPFVDRFNNPGAYGLTNVTDPAITTMGADPENYLFWDEFHPTVSAHEAIAEQVLALTAIPEPGSLALLFLGGCAGLRRRERT